jgi:polysaccharide pyruvyl transferase WcaK-like protein
MSEINDELILIDFNGHPHLGDFALHHEIASYAQRFCRVRHIRYSTNPLETLKEIAGLRVLIGMRLHAVIFGYMSSTPTLMLSYHQKCTEWALQSGMSEEAIFDSTDFETRTLVDATLRAYSNKLLPPKLPVEEAEILAMKNWNWMVGQPSVV